LSCEITEVILYYAQNNAVLIKGVKFKLLCQQLVLQSKYENGLFLIAWISKCNAFKRSFL